MEAHQTAVASAAWALAIVPAVFGLLIGHAHQKISYVLYVGAVMLAVAGAIVAVRKRPEPSRNRTPQTPPGSVLGFGSRHTDPRSDRTATGEQ
jgi:hypothetical protein